MYYEPLDAIPLWLLLPLTIGALTLAMEGGYRSGDWRRSAEPNEQSQPAGSIVAAILGLLALVLGFTFSLAASRFDARRMAVLEESNAIGTTFLRTNMLPEPQRAQSAQLLRDYANARLTAAQGDHVEEGLKQSEEIQAKLWEHATTASEKSQNPIMTSLYVQSLNEMIDLNAARVLVSLRSRIPLVIWAVLYGLALLGTASVGYYDGLSGTSRSPLMIALVLTFGVVLYLIADLDRGHEGLLRISQQSMRDLIGSMK